MASSVHPLLQVSNLCTSFFTDKGEIKAVDDVSFSLNKGQTLALVGESGCGKSVTALSIMRLLSSPGRVVGGTINFNGQDLLSLPEDAMRQVRGKSIAMVFQEPMTSLNPVMRIGDQVGEVLKIHTNLSNTEIRQEVLGLLEKVRIASPEQRMNQYPHEMSGGMKQRVMIAMALACNPDLLIADEPTTALDVTIQAQILDLLSALQKDLGMAILLITHNLGVVAQFAQDVIVMYASKIAERATVEELFRDPSHPYTRALLKSLPRPGRTAGEVRGDSRDRAFALAIPPRMPLCITMHRGLRPMSHTTASDDYGWGLTRGCLLAAFVFEFLIYRRTS